jgi:lipoate-protein ligase A
METLAGLGAAGASAFVGSCCEAFYIKHRRDMEQAGVPGLLFDVEGAETCYDLGKAAYAYRGEYQGETAVDLPLLALLLRGWPGRSARRTQRATRGATDGPPR